MAEKNDRVGEAFENALDQLRQERLSALGEAAAVHEAMQSLLQHEVQRTERKLGAEHARIQHLKAGLQANTQLLHALRLERELSRINVPEVAEEDALVHGRVVDDDERGISGLTVVLTDRSGAPVRDTAEPVTDGSGYFAIALDPSAVERLRQEHPEGMFVAVLTPRRRIVYRQSKPPTLARGSRVFVEDVRVKRSDLIETRSAVGTAGSQTVVVPVLVGRTLEEATRLIAKAGLTLGDVGGPSPTEGGVVSKQEPDAEIEVPVGRAVKLTLRRSRAKRAPDGRHPKNTR